MFRIALIIAALVSGHHHVTITHATGQGYMTTSLACVTDQFSQINPASTHVRCINGHKVIKTRFARRTVATRTGLLNVRRADVYNANGQLCGWVDWTRGARAIGHVLFRQSVEEVWQ